jgi:Right handed beta helix region
MTKQLSLLLGLLALIVPSFGFSQTCNCTYTIDTALANGISLSPSRTGIYHFNPAPGSVICLKGIYRDLRIEGITGTMDAPIIIKNFCDSVAKFVNTTSTPPFSLSNSKYVHIMGTGSAATEYGIVVDCNGSSGISVSGLNVRDIEIDHVEVKKAGFAGFMIKQDPTCDPKTWLDSTAYYNIKIHHNFVHDVAGEGFYIGNSFWQGGMTRTCNGQSIIVYPHRIYGLKVYNNIVRNTGWDGIQYGCSPNADVHDNLIENTGLQKVSQQMNGAQIGGGSGGRFYNNIIRNPGSTALAAIGFVDTVRIYNNLIVNAYEGIFADTRDSISTPKIELQIYNNTLVNIEQNGMTIYDNGYQYKNAQNQWVFFPRKYQPRVKNNVIIGPYFDFRLLLRDPTITIDSSHNYRLRTPFSSPPQYFAAQKQLFFADTLMYQLKANSYLIDKGTSAVSNIVTTDMLGMPRPQDNLYDLGAYEYIASAPHAQNTGTSLSRMSGLRVYPTIASETVSVDVPNLEEETELYVVDIMGRVYLKQKLSATARQQLVQIDVYHLQDGFYVCILKSQSQMQSVKFAKF